MPETSLAFNPFEPGFFENPYPQYAALREADPVHFSPLGIWMLLRYDDCSRVLRDPNLSVDDQHVTEGAFARDAMMERLGLDPEDRRGSRSILNLDPPDHTRLRRLVQKAFTPRMVEELRPRAQQVVDDLLAEVADRDEIDLISDLAFPLPFTVICDMLGMPVSDDRNQLRAWSHTLVKTLDPILTDDDVLAARDAGQAMFEYVSAVVAEKRSHPGDDLLTGLIQAEEDGDQLDDEELLDQVMLLFIAGHETTVNLVGNGTLALLQHPDQLQRLRDDPSLVTNAVDELLRFDSPVQNSRRIALRDLEFDGTVIPTGSIVITALASANRDPAKWGDTADHLDLARQGASQHLSFGGGVHHCLGAALARVEGQVAIGTLVARHPDLALAGEPVRNNRIVLRGLEGLPVALR